MAVARDFFSTTPWTCLGSGGDEKNGNGWSLLQNPHKSQGRACSSNLQGWAALGLLTFDWTLSERGPVFPRSAPKPPTAKARPFCLISFARNLVTVACLDVFVRPSVSGPLFAPGLFARTLFIAYLANLLPWQRPRFFSPSFPYLLSLSPLTWSEKAGTSPPPANVSTAADSSRLSQTSIAISSLSSPPDTRFFPLAID